MKFNGTAFINATSIHPEIMKLIVRSLLSAEINLSISSSPGLAFARVISQVLKVDLLIIVSPAVRWGLARLILD
jgi:hypothetical protein